MPVCGKFHETYAVTQAPASTALFSTGSRSSGRQFGFATSSAQSTAADADGKAAEQQQARAAGANGKQQKAEQQAEQQADSAAEMSPEQLVQAYQEAKEALDGERKRVNNLASSQ
jgi:hypothetical protein